RSEGNGERRSERDWIEIAIREVRGDRIRVASNSEPKENQRRERSGFYHGHGRLYPLPFLDATEVDPRQHPDRDQRDETLGREPELDGVARRGKVHLREPGESVRTDRRPKHAKIFPERHGDSGDGSC